MAPCANTQYACLLSTGRQTGAISEEASHCSLTHTLLLRCPELVYSTYQYSAVCSRAAALKQACLSERM